MEVIEDKVIEFDTAILAKEKGFKNIWTEVYYEERDDEFRGVKAYMNEYIDYDDVGKKCVFYHAPTQSQLQRWLREGHQIDITVSLVGNAYGFYIHFYGNYTNEGDNYGVIGTYEEALEKGLVEALKLIN